MTSELIAPEDRNAFFQYTEFMKLDPDDAVAQFEDQYLGEWRSIRDFARDRIMWEHGLPRGLVAFVNLDTYLDSVLAVHACFVVRKKEDGTGVYIFQIADEPDWWADNA